ncbi:MAG: SPOR domain-containing protein [Planctomycetes bacterium]|nr:SPOR domain-containing protein [Planctomycetota bacterium]
MLNDNHLCRVVDFKSLSERSLTLFLLSAILLSGCSKVSEHIQPMQRERVELNKNLIEKAALSEDWPSIRKHLLKIEVDALNQNDKAYSLYWMGVSHYHLGHPDTARHHLNKAAGFSRDKNLSEQINQAQAGLGVKSANIKWREPLAAGTWVLQFGVFSIRKSAEDLGRELAWKGVDVQVNEMYIRGKKRWVAWFGPMRAQQAQAEKMRLEKLGVNAYLKASEEFL